MTKSSPSTRDKILIAAATMLAADPTARLSVRAVAANAGVSVGSLRHFFPTQQELIGTVVAALHTVDVPDDPMEDADLSPAERLEACLRLMLAEIGTGDAARQFLGSLYRVYIATPPRDDAVQAFSALERLALRRVERWLAALYAPDPPAADEIERHARFLVTIVNGLALERALPGAHGRLAHETATLRTAVDGTLAALG